MATVERKVCDVFGTLSQGIERYTVRLAKSDDKADVGDAECVIHADLSPRAVKRAERLIRRAFAPPGAVLSEEVTHGETT